MQEQKKILPFDEWLFRRLGMTEKELRAALEKSLPWYHYESERPDAVIACYRRKHREEMDIIASEGIDYTFREWMQVYVRHTPETFHEMCDGTGMTPREEARCMNYLIKKWKKRREALNPFINERKQED